MARRPRSHSQQLWVTIIAVSSGLLVLLGWSFLYLEPNTPSYVIGQVSAVVLGVTIVGVAIALYSGWSPF